MWSEPDITAQRQTEWVEYQGLEGIEEVVRRPVPLDDDKHDWVEYDGLDGIREIVRERIQPD
jgi:hypothetical protein